MTIGKMITKYRKEENLSQEKLANKLGITRQTLSNYENDLTIPDLEMAQKIAKELNLSLDELVGLENSDILFKKMNHTEKIVKKQTKYIKVVLITVYFIIFIGVCLVGIYFLVNKDFTNDDQFEFTCYNKKLNENYYISVLSIEEPYYEYTKKAANFSVYVTYGDENKANTIVDPYEEKKVLTKFIINIDGYYVHGGNTFEEVIDNLQVIKSIAIKQGYTCR